MTSNEGPPGEPDYSSLPPPPAGPGTGEPPQHQAADPWAFDHGANQPSSTWGSTHVPTGVGGGLRYTSTPMHQPASKTPLVIFLVIAGLLALIGGGAAWYFLIRDSTVLPAKVDDPELLSIEAYSERVCHLFLELVVEFQPKIEELDEVESELEGIQPRSKAEILARVMPLLEGPLDVFESITEHVWQFNEEFVVDHPDGAELRLIDRQKNAESFRLIADLRTEVAALSPDMSKPQIDRAIDRIEEKFDYFMERLDGADPSGLELESLLDSELQRRDENCEVIS